MLSLANPLLAKGYQSREVQKRHFNGEGDLVELAYV